MNLFKLLDSVSHEILIGGDAEIEHITLDSRTVSEGSLFFAIKGLKEDGHSYISDVSKAGAVCVVVSDEPEVLPRNMTVVKVENVRAAMSQIAGNFYGNPAKSLKIAGITGTNGKTTVSTFLSDILINWGKKCGLIGTIKTSINNEDVDVDFATSTTPDAIELQHIFGIMKDENVEFVSMEVTSHALALDKVKGVAFKVGTFTNLTQDHLDFHGDFESYFKAKSELFNMCEYAVFNADDPYGERLANHATKSYLKYSIDNKSDFKAYDVKLSPNGVSFNLNIQDGKQFFPFECPIAGRFTVYNMLATICTAVFLGVPIGIMQETFAEMKIVPGRIEHVENWRGLSVIVDYSHTPDSLLNIITAVKEFTKGRVITVFGCGGDRDKTKRPIMGKISTELSDYSIITSDNPRTENPETIIEDVKKGCANENFEAVVDRREAIFKAIAMAKKEDTVIIAGKGHEDYQILADKTIHFDDVEVAKEAIKAAN